MVYAAPTVGDYRFQPDMRTVAAGEDMPYARCSRGLDLAYVKAGERPERFCGESATGKAVKQLSSLQVVADGTRAVLNGGDDEAMERWLAGEEVEAGVAAPAVPEEVMQSATWAQSAASSRAQLEELRERRRHAERKACGGGRQEPSLLERLVMAAEAGAEGAEGKGDSRPEDEPARAPDAAMVDEAPAPPGAVAVEEHRSLEGALEAAIAAVGGEQAPPLVVGVEPAESGVAPVPEHKVAGGTPDEEAHAVARDWDAWDDDDGVRAAGNDSVALAQGSDDEAPSEPQVAAPTPPLTPAPPRGAPAPRAGRHARLANALAGSEEAADPEYAAQVLQTAAAPPTDRAKAASAAMAEGRAALQQAEALLSQAAASAEVPLAPAFAAADPVEAAAARGDLYSSGESDYDDFATLAFQSATAAAAAAAGAAPKKSGKRTKRKKGSAAKGNARPVSARGTRKASF